MNHLDNSNSRLKQKNFFSCDKCGKIVQKVYQSKTCKDCLTTQLQSLIPVLNSSHACSINKL